MFAVFEDNNGKQIFCNNFNSVIKEHYNSLSYKLLAIRKKIQQAPLKEGQFYQFKQKNNHSGSFNYAIASNGAFFPFDYFNHNINHSNDMTLCVRVKSVFNDKYSDQIFKLKNAASIYFWNKVREHQVKIHRDGNDVYLAFAKDYKLTGEAVKLELI